jgi:hypothetical protein
MNALLQEHNSSGDEERCETELKSTSAVDVVVVVHRSSNGDRRSRTRDSGIAREVCTIPTSESEFG